MSKIYRYMGISELAKFLNNGKVEKDFVGDWNKINFTNIPDDEYKNLVNTSFYFFPEKQTCITSGISRSAQEIEISIEYVLRSLPYVKSDKFHALAEFEVTEENLEKYFSEDIGRYADNVYDLADEASLMFKEFRIQDEYSNEYMTLNKVCFYDLPLESTFKELTQEELDEIKSTNGLTVMSYDLFSDRLSENFGYFVVEPINFYEFRYKGGKESCFKSRVQEDMNKVKELFLDFYIREMEEEFEYLEENSQKGKMLIKIKNNFDSTMEKMVEEYSTKFEEQFHPSVDSNLVLEALKVNIEKFSSENLIFEFV